MTFRNSRIKPANNIVLIHNQNVQFEIHSFNHQYYDLRTLKHSYKRFLKIITKYLIKHQRKTF